MLWSPRPLMDSHHLTELRTPTGTGAPGDQDCALFHSISWTQHRVWQKVHFDESMIHQFLIDETIRKLND